MISIKVTNLLRLSRRLSTGSLSKEKFEDFEKALHELWSHLTPLQKQSLEEIHQALRSRYSASDKSDMDLLFGPKPVDTSVVDQFTQADLERQILELAKNMKAVAGNFTSALQHDNSLLESISNKQSKYITEISVEGKRIDSIVVKTSMWSTIKSFVAVIFSLFLFICMMMIIHFFPSTTYIQLK